MYVYIYDNYVKCWFFYFIQGVIVLSIFISFWDENLRILLKDFK